MYYVQARWITEVLMDDNTWGSLMQILLGNRLFRCSSEFVALLLISCNSVPKISCIFETYVQKMDQILIDNLLNIMMCSSPALLRKKILIDSDSTTNANTITGLKVLIMS